MSDREVFCLSMGMGVGLIPFLGYWLSIRNKILVILGNKPNWLTVGRSLTPEPDSPIVYMPTTGMDPALTRCVSIRIEGSEIDKFEVMTTDAGILTLTQTLLSNIPDARR